MYAPHGEYTISHQKKKKEAKQNEIKKRNSFIFMMGGQKKLKIINIKFEVLSINFSYFLGAYLGPIWGLFGAYLGPI